MLRVRVLGGLAVDVDGVACPAPETARGRALLAWCALHPGAHPRAGLAAALRPDVLDRSARATLRQAIWSVRQALGDAADDVLVAERDRFGLRARDLWVDLLELRSLAAEGHVEDALALAAGDVLPELDDEWVLAERGTHRDEVGELLRRLADTAEAGGDLAVALRWSRRALDHDPLSERTARALMTRLAFAGDRPAALAVHRALGERLRRELGVAPSGATRELAERIRSGEEELPAAPPAQEASPRDAAAGPATIPLPPRLAEAPRTPFVGREDALARLRAAWEGVVAGGRRMVEVWGEPGIGKTRLARELAAEAHAGGAVVLLGWSDEEPLAPFHCFVEALGHAVRALPPSELRALTGPDAAHLARLVPELAERVRPAADASAPGGDGDERLRLFEAVAALLGGLSERAPLLLVLDDLHWADGPTRKLLRHVLRSARGPRRVLVLATCRDGGDAPVEAEREVGVDRIRLEGLDAAAAAELLGGAAPRRAADLAGRTRGNPFFLELFRSGAAEGDARELPAGVRDAIARSLASRSEPTRDVLTLAAVAGLDFDVAVLEAAAAGDADVLAALDEAALAGMIEEDPDVHGRFRFRHALVREVLYHQPGRVRRARLHLRLAGGLERGDRQVGAGRDAEVAHHRLSALPEGDPAEAVTAAARAAEHAARLLAYEDAADLCRRALASVPESAMDRAARAELLVALGEAEQRAGARDRARPPLVEAARMAREAGDGKLLARAALAHGGVGVVIGHPDTPTLELLRDALALLGEDDPLRPRILARLSTELYYADRDEAEELSARAVDRAREHRDPAALASALNARHVALWTPDHVAERLEIAAEMEEMALRAGDREQALQAHNWLVLDLAELGEMAAVASAVDAYERDVAGVRVPSYEWYVPLWRATLAMVEGRFDDAAALSDQARDSGRRAQDPNADLFWFLQRMVTEYETRTYDDLHLQRVHAQIAASPVPEAWRPWLPLLYAETGDLPAARRELETFAADGFAAIPADANWHVICDIAEAAAMVGERAWCELLYERLSPYAALQPVIARFVGTYGPVEFFLARLAAALGRDADAEHHFARALEAGARLGAASRLALTQERFGEHLLARGDTRGTDLLHAALERCTRLGLYARAERVRGTLQTA